MVRVDTIMGSTPYRPSVALATALTILLTSTGSSVPLRLRTRMLVVTVEAAGVLCTALSRSCCITILRDLSVLRVSRSEGGSGSFLNTALHLDC